MRLRSRSAERAMSNETRFSGVTDACLLALRALMENEDIARELRAAPSPTLRRYRSRFAAPDFHALMALGRNALLVLEPKPQDSLASVVERVDSTSDLRTWAVRGRVELIGAAAQSVAGLTVELWEKNAAWAIARTSVVTDALGKFEALIHARDLSTPSREIYFRLLSDGSYIEPDPTQTWSPVEGVTTVVLAVTGTHIQGYLRSQDGTPVSGYTVKAFDVQLAGENLLAQTTTDTNGFYNIDVAYAGAKLDLMVRAYSGITEKAHAELTANVGQSIEVDLVVGNTELAGTSEYGAIAAAIEASRGAVAAKDLTSANVTTIANKFGLSPNLIQLAVDANAAAFYAGAGLLPELFYAIGHARQRVSVSAALAVTAADRQGAVNHAITGNLVSSTFANVATSQLTTLEGLRANFGVTDASTGVISRLSVILAVAGITSTSTSIPPASGSQQALLNAYVNYSGSLEQFWADPTLPGTTGLTGAQLTNAKNALGMGIYTLNHPPMVQSLWLAGIQTAADLAKQTKAQLITRIGSSVTLPGGSSAITVGVPGEVFDTPGTPGTADEYATAMVTALAQAFPSNAVVTAYSGSPLTGTTAAGANVGTFFSSNPSFDFASTSLPAFVRSNPSAFSSNTGAQPLVERVARLFKVAPEVNRYSTVQGLWNAGFTSARSISLYGREPFIALMTSATYGWSSDLAKQVYVKASHTSALATQIAMQYGASFQAPGAGGALPQLGFDATGALAAPSTIADWSSMFGSLDYCQCDECASVLGAAAYLTDLLHFLEQRPSGATPTMLRALKTRRPDITKIQLSCTNTNTLVPSIDITNEVLEQRVVDPSAISGLTAWYRADSLVEAADPAAIGATILARYRADQGVVLVAANVVRWNDIGPSGDGNRHATQATAANQPTYNASNVAFNGQPTVKFQPGTSGQWLATPNWSAAQAQPVTIFIIAKDNAAHATTNTYFVDSIDSAHQFAVYADHSNGALGITGSLNSGVAVDGAASLLVAQFDTNFKLAVGTNAYNNTVTGVGTTGFAGVTIGSYAGHGVLYSNSDIAEIVYFQGDLTQTQVQQLAAYARERYGVDYTIGRWNDQSALHDTTHDLLQTTSGAQPTLKVVDPNYNYQPTVAFSAAGSNRLVSSTWASSLTHPETIFIVGNFDGTTANQYLADGGTLNERVIFNSAGTTDGGIYAGTTLSSGTARTSKPHVICGVFNAASSAIRVDTNTPNATGTSGTTDPRTALTLGSGAATPGEYLNGSIAEVIIYNRALTAAEIAEVNAYLGARYGITIDTPAYNQTTWSADDLALHPEHLLTAAYDTLATKVYPWSMPYNLYLDETRSYVAAKNTTRSAILFAPLAATLVADPYTDASWAREVLAMSELQLEVIQGSGSLVSSLAATDYWGLSPSPATPWYARFVAVSVLLAKSGLSFDDASAVVASKYVQASSGITLNLHGSCDTEKATLDGLDLSGTTSASFFDRFHRFTRLHYALG